MAEAFICDTIRADDAQLMIAGGVTMDQLDVIELNEAFVSQTIAVLRNLGLFADDKRANRNDGTIASAADTPWSSCVLGSAKASPCS